VRLHVLIAVLIGLVDHLIDLRRIHAEPLDRDFSTEWF